MTILGDLDDVPPEAAEQIGGTVAATYVVLVALLAAFLLGYWVLRRIRAEQEERY
jgi:flagellar biogenesis protein FliO